MATATPLRIFFPQPSTSDEPSTLMLRFCVDRPIAAQTSAHTSHQQSILTTHRWARRYMASNDQLEHPLIGSLKSLRRRVFTWQQQPWQSIKLSVYLSPFLDVIRSDIEAADQSTGSALSAVYKVVTFEVFDAQNTPVYVVMHVIVDAVTSCRFEVPDPASEEIVSVFTDDDLLLCATCVVDFRQGISEL